MQLMGNASSLFVLKRERTLVLRLLTHADVPGDLGHARDLPCSISERGHRQRNIDQTSILAAPDSFIVFDLLATSYALKNYGFLMQEVPWKQKGDRFADDLIGCVPEKAFGSRVPAGNHAIQVLTDDGVIRGLDDRGEQLPCLLCVRAFGEINQHVHRTDDIASRIMQRRRVRHEWHSRAIGTLCNGFHASYGAASFQGDCHWAFVVRQRRSVRPVESPSDAPFIAADFGLPPSQAGLRPRYST